MPIITLTSDFGTQNHTLSSVKGRILTSFPDVSIVDITHTVTPFNLQQTVYVFKHAYRHFPQGTFHFIFSELYAHPARQLLYVYEYGQHIFCGDNGFITMLFDDKPVQIYRLTENVHPFNIITVTDQFLGSSAALLHQQHIGLENVTVHDIVVKQPTHASFTANMLEAQILYIDHFGNVVLNVTYPQFEEARRGRKFKILFMRDEEITALSEHYNDVPEGEKLCLFNTAHHLEIAVNRGNASRLFGLKENNDQSLFYNTIKLFFE